MAKFLLARLRRDPLQTTILLLVLSAHALFFLAILLSPWFHAPKKIHKPLVVHTIIPKTAAVEKKKPAASPKPAAKPQPKAAPQNKPQAIPKPQPQTKKEPPPAVVKKPAAKPAPVVKKEPAIADKILTKKAPPPAKKTPPAENRARISDSLLQELEESIAKIENKSDKAKFNKAATTATPSPIQLQIDTQAGEEETSSDYTDNLVGHLHRTLSLPDYGEVKIQLSLRQDGTVAKVIVLNAQSVKNRQYLETHLPRLKFPRFAGAYATKSEQTFVLTFCNEL
jgi:outer membrane biosynthesis protein TonB